MEALLNRIHENPAKAGSCYLPMTASILVHLFKTFNNTLPTSQYSIFSELVLSCIYRHLGEHKQIKSLTLKSLHLIPEDIREPFLFLCELAYKGIIENRVVFSLPADIHHSWKIWRFSTILRRTFNIAHSWL